MLRRMENVWAAADLSALARRAAEWTALAGVAALLCRAWPVPGTAPFAMAFLAAALTAGWGAAALVAGCLLRDSFYDLRLDIERLSCAAYMANICEATVQPDENAQRPFLLLARALGYLSYHGYAPRAVLSAFLLHYAIALGYKPRLNHCVICGQAIEPGAGALFDIEQGGVVCPACAGEMRRGAALPYAELAWLREALTQGVRGELPPEDAPLPLMQAYLESRIEKKIPKLMVKL